LGTTAPDFKSFHEVVKWIVDTHYGGAVLRMAAPTGVSQGMLHRYYHNQAPRGPQWDTVLKVCAPHGLDPMRVWAAIQRYQPAPTRRLAKAARRGAAALTLVLGLSTPSVASDAHPLPEPPTPYFVLLIGCIYRWYRKNFSLGVSAPALGHAI
jgi:hypothetical protein